MTDENNQVALDNGSQNKFNVLYESTFFIAIITASLYFVGNAFYSYYFSRLSIPLRFIDIEKTNYLVVGFIPVVILGLFIAIFLKFWSKEPKNRLEALYCNQLFIIISLIIIINYNLDFKNSRFITPFTMIFLFVILFFILATYSKFSTGYQLYKGGFYTRIIAVFVIIGCLYLIAGILGIQSAENLIQEKGNVLEIQLSPKDKMDTQLRDKTFIFVMQHDNKYYVLEKNVTIQKYPKVYVIPVDQIEIATIYRAANK